MKLPTEYPIYPLGDNEILYFGGGSDAAIYYDGTDFKINPKVVGSGKADFLGDISLPSDSSKIILGAGDDIALYFDGTTLCIDGPAHELRVNLSTAANGKLYGGKTAGDVLDIYGSLGNSLPYIDIAGGGAITFQLPATTALQIYNNTNAEGYIYGDGTDLYIATFADKNIFLMPNGSGKVKFGTYSAGLVVCTGTIAILDAAGTATRVLVAQP